MWAHRTPVDRSRQGGDVADVHEGRRQVAPHDRRGRHPREAGLQHPACPSTRRQPRAVGIGEGDEPPVRRQHGLDGVEHRHLQGLGKARERKAADHPIGRRPTARGQQRREILGPRMHHVRLRHPRARARRQHGVGFHRQHRTARMTPHQRLGHRPGARPELHDGLTRRDACRLHHREGQVLRARRHRPDARGVPQEGTQKRSQVRHRLLRAQEVPSG